jgi:hypothetical protein
MNLKNLLVFTSAIVMFTIVSCRSGSGETNSNTQTTTDTICPHHTAVDTLVTDTTVNQ